LEHIAETDRETRKFRLAALLLAMGPVGIAVLIQRGAFDPGLVNSLMALVAIYLVYYFVLVRFLIPRYPYLPLVYGMLVVDVATVGGAVYLFGITSPIVVLMAMVVVYYAIFLGYQGSLTAATLASFAFLGLALARGQAAELGPQLSVQISLFYVLAILTGYLARQRLREREERRILQQLYEAEAQGRRLLQAMQHVEERLDIGAIAQDICSMAQAVTGAPNCVLLVADDVVQNQLVARAAKVALDSLSDAPLDSYSLPLGGPMAQAVFNARGPLVLSGETLRHLRPSWAAQEPGLWLAAIPLVADVKPLGMLLLFDTEQRVLGELASFTEIAVRSLGNAQRYAEAKTSSQRLMSELEQTIGQLGRFREVVRTRPPISLGKITLDPQWERVVVNGTQIPLSKNEFDILYILAERPGAIVNAETLVREVWGESYVPQGNVVDVTIHRMRRKLQTAPETANLIRTIRGRGYTFNPPRRGA